MFLRINVKLMSPLLNPHGSDETHWLKEPILIPRKLLNPHGSDETKPDF